MSNKLSITIAESDLRRLKNKGRIGFEHDGKKYELNYVNDLGNLESPPEKTEESDVLGDD